MSLDGRCYRECLYNREWLFEKKHKDGSKTFHGHQIPQGAQDGDTWLYDTLVLLRRGEEWLADGFVELEIDQQG